MAAASIRSLCRVAGLVVAARIAAAGPEPAGLLLWYGFDRNDGAVVRDLSGNGRDGKVDGPVWESAGPAGGCLRFSRQGDVVLADDRGLPEGDAPRTVAWWFCLDRLRSDPVSTDLISYGSREPARFFALAVDWRIGRDCLAVSPWGWVALSQRPIRQAGRWHHAVLVYAGGGSFTYYLDGEACPTVNEAPLPIETRTGGGFRIGSYDAKVHGIEGLIDDVRVYGRALSAVEARQVFRAGAASTVAAAANRHATRPPDSTPHAVEAAAGTAGQGGTAPGSAAAADFAVTRIGFSNAADGDQDVTIFYPGERLFVRVEDVDFAAGDTNLQVRVSAYQHSEREGKADATALLAPGTNGLYTGVLDLAPMKPGRVLVDIAAYDLRGRAMRLFRTSSIRLMSAAP